MGQRGWLSIAAAAAAPALVFAAAGCGGKLLPDPDARDDGGDRSLLDASTSPDATQDGGQDGGLPDGPPTDERGPPPVPECMGNNSMCVPPEAGVVWTGAAVIKCQPEQYVGPWTLVLERLIGTTYQVVQKQVVQEPGFGATFEDTTSPPSRITYRVCSVENDTTALCGEPFTTDGPVGCACEPTSCYLQSACNTTIDDQCGGTIDCGACANGVACNPENDTCCPQGFMSNGWGACVCAPPVYYINGVNKGCSIWDWNTTLCICQPSGG